MSTIIIRKLETDGSRWFDAEVTWDPSDPSTPPAQVNRNYDVPGGGIASLTVTPTTTDAPSFGLKIIPDDVPDSDNLTLRISASDALPSNLVGTSWPSAMYPTPYVVQALDDTVYGFRLMTGL